MHHLWLKNEIPNRAHVDCGHPQSAFVDVSRIRAASIRARIPYDAREASESKGDIRSFWDLHKLVLADPAEANSSSPTPDRR